MEFNESNKYLKTLERVKGIEPSYSAWKAAALPLSYTRAPVITYHGAQAASTRLAGGLHCRRRALFPGFHAASGLNSGGIAAYILISAT